MNKNPFAAAPSYTPQPPLPPGPPPPAPAQPDYNAYWAAATAATAAHHIQTPTIGTYNPQWTAAQPAQAAAVSAAARPTPEQSALYANYGYGGQHNVSWQQQQQRQPQQQHFQPPPPVVQPPPPPPPQPAYNPYQPQAGTYQQPYVPQVAPPQPIPQQAQYTPIPPPQQFHQQQQQQQQQFFPQQQQQQQQNRHNNNIRNHNIHHTPPQHLPPAKRPRFDNPPQYRQPPPQPQFQVPPPPPMQGQNGPTGGGMGMHNQGYVRGGGPNQMGGNRGGFNNGRGGNNQSRGRGIMMNRGGSRGRGSGVYNNQGGRGGGPGQGGGNYRGHPVTRGFGNRDNRRGGSFNAGGQGYSYGHQQQHQQQPQQYQPQLPQQQQHHQQYQSGPFRGRSQGHFNSNSGRGGRHDYGTAHKDLGSGVSSGFASGKKDENRRTLTDFKIIGLEIPDLAWNWGTLPSHSDDAEGKENIVENPSSSATVVDAQASELTTGTPAAVVAKTDVAPSSTEVTTDSSQSTADTSASVAVVNGKTEAIMLVPPPPSRIRIYFHTPVTADDSHPITHQSSFSLGMSSQTNVRKGKRKKLEDDDGDMEDGRGPPPPPPHMSGEHDSVSVSANGEYDGNENAIGRDSAAPSVAETASEGDWLMAAIGEDDVDAEGDEELNMNEIEHVHDPNADGGDYGKPLILNDDCSQGVDATFVIEPIHTTDTDFLVEGNDYDYMQGDGHQESHNGTGDEGHFSMDANEGDVAHYQGNMPPGPNDIVGSEDPSHAGQNDAFDTSDVIPHHEETGPIAALSGNSADDISSDPVQSANPHAHRDTSSTNDDPAATAQETPDVSDSAEAAIPSTQPADPIPNPDSQIRTPSQPRTGAPLQAQDSLASTVPDTNGRDDFSPYASTVLNEESQPTVEEPAEGSSQPIKDEPTDEHHMPDASHSAAPLIGPQGSVESIVTPDAKSGKMPSANRLSVSYASGSRRMIIDAEVVDKLKVFRNEGRIEVYINVIRNDEKSFKGIVIEGLAENSEAYTPLDLTDALEGDNTVPPFSKATSPSQTMLIAHLDTARPLSEPKWVRTGDVQEWLKSMFGRMFWAAGDAAEGWEKKIEVVDPDPAPTIWTVLEAWSGHSNVGVPNERQRFIRTHMTETDNILEILLRLVRGERATYNQTAPVTTPTISGPLLAALSLGSAHGAQQTHVSLAVLAIFRLAVEYAKKAVGDNGKGEVEERVGEIIRFLPQHLIYKSLDGIFKEWRVEKKGGR